MTRVKVRGGRCNLGASLSREINTRVGRRGPLGSVDAQRDSEMRDQREGMLGLGGAWVRVVRRNWDAVGARRATRREGWKVLRVGGCRTSEAAREGDQLVSDMGVSRGIIAADVDDRETAVADAREIGSVQVGGASEIAGEAGDVSRVGVRSQDADGRNHPFIGEKL